MSELFDVVTLGYRLRRFTHGRRDIGGAFKIDDFAGIKQIESGGSHVVDFLNPVAAVLFKRFDIDHLHGVVRADQLGHHAENEYRGQRQQRPPGPPDATEILQPLDCQRG
jgi:hypothetical protein